MIDSDKKQFMQVLSGVHAFYNRDLSDFAFGVWWRACETYDIGAVIKAFDAHLTDPKSGQFLPKPADIVRALQGTHEDRSMVAWGQSLDAVSRVGAYRSVIFDDPVIHAVITDMGGWPQFCRAGFDELPFIQKRFCDAYRAYSAKKDFRYPPRLCGETEIFNVAKGYPLERGDTVLIGDQDRARMVLEGGSEMRSPMLPMADLIRITQGDRNANSH